MVSSQSAPRWRLPALMVATTVGLLLLVAWLVDLKPEVDQQFFFASDDPQLRESNVIDRRFPSGSQLILSVSSPDISSAAYLERLERLTEQISSIRSVTGVRSLAKGPKDYEDAEKSPLWSRPLIAK